MNKKTRRRIVLAAIVLLLLYPFQTMVVPAWQLQVFHSDGRPASDLSVSYSWQHASIERERHEERTRTDAQGRLSFPARTTRASVIQRIAVAALNVPWVVHASWGPHALLLVGGGLYEVDGVLHHSEEGSIWYRGEGVLPEQLVLEPTRPMPPPTTNYFPNPTPQVDP